MRITLCLLLMFSSALGVSAQLAAKVSESEVTAPAVFVVGKILKATTLPWHTSLTLMEAIRLSGGTEKPEKKMSVKLTRRISECEQISYLIDLRDILKKRRNDFLLKPSDIVDVRFGNRKSKGGPITSNPCKDKIPTIHVIIP